MSGYSLSIFVFFFQFQWYIEELKYKACIIITTVQFHM